MTGSSEGGVGAAGVQLHDGLGMSGGIGVQAAQPAELVRMAGHVGQQLGEPGARLAVLLEAELGGGERAAAGAGLAAVFLQPRLVFECVHLRDRSLVEEEDDALGLGFDVRRLRRQGFGGRGFGFILAEQAGKGQVAKTGARWT